LNQTTETNRRSGGHSDGSGESQRVDRSRQAFPAALDDLVDLQKRCGTLIAFHAHALGKP